MAIVAGALVIGLMVCISADVTARYLFKSPISWVFESTEYGLLYITFLGAAWLLRRDGHVRVDVVLNRLSPQPRLILEIITFLILAGICFMLFWYGTQVTIDNFKRGILSVKYYEVPKFIFLAVIPLGSLLLFIESIKKIINQYRLIKIRK